MKLVIDTCTGKTIPGQTGRYIVFIIFDGKQLLRTNDKK